MQVTGGVNLVLAGMRDDLPKVSGKIRAMQTQSTASVSATVMKPDRIVRGNFASRTWIMVFPLVSAALFFAQPSAMTTGFGWRLPVTHDWRSQP